MAMLGIGVALMTQLTKDTPLPVLWLWMFIAGLGVGPTFSVFTIVIQNAVPFKELGVATSNLTFFRQIGGSVALAFVGTIFAQSFTDDLIPQFRAAGVPEPLIQGFQQNSGSFDVAQLTGVGDISAALAKVLPPEAQQFIPNIIQGIHGAFSLATAQTFWLGVIGAVLAVGAGLFIKEIPLRQSNAAPIPTEAIGAAGAQGQPATSGTAASSAPTGGSAATTTD